MTRVLVLGAGGFVGRHLVAALAATGDLVPVALVRGAPPVLPAGVALRQADATDAEALGRALAGVEAAVNCVAGPGATMEAVTRNLLAAAPRHGLRRIVHLSSMAVYGEAAGRVDEDHRVDGTASRYAAAKVACEGLVRAAPGIETVILRPGCIHGPDGRQWTERLGRLLAQRRIGDLGENGDGICNLTFIDDMTRAVAAALRRPDAAGGVFNVSDPDPATWNRYLVALGRAIGAVPVARVPGLRQAAEVKLLAPPLALAERLAGRLPLGVRTPACVTPAMARLWRQEITLDHRRADAGLAFARTPPAEALAAAARWLRGALAA